MRVQLALQAQDAPTMTGRLPFRYYQGNAHEIISKIVDKSVAQADPNAELVKMGILEVRGGEKLPTRLGEFLGVSAMQPKGKDYHVVQYDATAEHLVKLLLENAPNGKN